MVSPAGGSAGSAGQNTKTAIDVAAVETEPAAVTDDAAQSPRDPAYSAKWSKAKDAVQRHVGLSTAFATLRDMKSSDAIRPEQLKTLKVLGQGAFAIVDKAM